MCESLGNRDQSYRHLLGRYLDFPFRKKNARAKTLAH